MRILRIFAYLCFAWLTSGNTIAQELEINVLSFNIRYGTANDGPNHWTARKELVFDVIRHHSPDVMGLQEALRFQIDEIKMKIPGYSEIGEGRNGGKEGEYSAIFYNDKRFDVDTSGTFWLSDTPEVPSKHWGNDLFRICTWVRLIDTESKTSFYVYNTHLDHESQLSREKSVRLISDRIINRIHPDPFVFTGDFNAGEDNPVILFLTGDAVGGDITPLPMVDAFRVLHESEQQVGTFNGFEGKTDGAKIDYIFVPLGMTVLSAEILRTNTKGRYPSDHFPVTTRLRLKVDPAQGAVTTEKIEAIDLFLNHQTENGFSGSVLISQQNKIFHCKGYGYANRELEIPNTAKTLFEIASITKLFTVIAILQLVENGQISLEDKMEKHLGDFDDPKDQATINHLLIHTAGLVPRGHELNYDSRKEFVESVKRTPPESKPGEKYRYTNAGYTLLAAIIELISGLSYEAYLTKNIFKPLNLTNTTYGSDENLNNIAIGYTGKTIDSLQAYYTPEPVWGNRGPSGIITNVGDMHLFLLALEEGSLISNESRQKMFNEQIAGEAYGFHVLRKTNIGRVLARGGGLPHFESQIVWYKDKNIKLIYTINNRLRFRQSIWDGVEEILFK